MRKLLSMVHMLLYAIRRFLHNPRTYIVAVTVCVYFSMITDPIHQYVEITGEPVSPWLMPFIFSNQICVLIMYMLLILLFCDAPFIQQNEVYVMVRSGRKKWMFTQFLYVCVVSEVYMLFLHAAAVGQILTDTAYMPEWGKIFYSLANTTASDLVKMPIRISGVLIQNFTPQAALLLSTFYAWSISVFLGSVMFVINLSFNRTAGTVVSTLIVLLQYLADNASGYAMTYFSPASWVNLNLLDFTGVGHTPSPAFAAIVLWSLILLCWVASLLVMRRKDIDIYRTL